MSTRSPDRLLAAREVRDRLGGVSAMSLWRWQRSGILPTPTKINGRNYWPEVAVTAVMQRAAPQVPA